MKTHQARESHKGNRRTKNMLQLERRGEGRTDRSVHDVVDIKRKTRKHLKT
jgi:hypothetical protein